MAGLLAHAIEQAYGEPDFMPARFTIDMYRLPDLSAATLKLTPIREGHRIKVIDAEYSVNGLSMARHLRLPAQVRESRGHGMDAAQLGCAEAGRHHAA